jgi:hypothetical protein
MLIACNDDQDKNLFSHTDADSKKTFSSPESFYFVGINKSNSSIYKYDFESRKSSVFWYSRKERVIDLIYTDDFETVFFIAARRFGYAAAFPFIEKANLYRIDPETQQVTLLKELGDAIQIYSFWSEEGNYNLIINSFDPKVNTYVIQNTLLYNRFGRILSDHTETSDLLISGYPAFERKETRTNSYDGRFRIFSVLDSVFIRDYKSKEKIFVINSDKKLNEVQWIPGRSLVVFSLINLNEKAELNNDKISSLHVFDLHSGKILKTFDKPGLFRFALTNDFLIFDEGFARNSRINIIDLDHMKEYHQINIIGGCGLRNVPLNPFVKN